MNWLGRPYFEGAKAQRRKGLQEGFKGGLEKFFQEDRERFKGFEESRRLRRFRRAL
jgi:hypothetical protein